MPRAALQALLAGPRAASGLTNPIPPGIEIRSFQLAGGVVYLCQMDDDRKWHLAWAQLDAFKENLPDSVEEKHVVEFHGILKLLHEATSEDISAFQIPDSEIKPRIVSVLRPTRRSPGSAQYSQTKYCNRDLMLRKIGAVYGYFKRLEPAPERTPTPEKPKYGF